MASRWDSSERAQEAQRNRTGGHNLSELLKALYIQKKLSAKDLSMLCFYCAEAGVRGADFSRLALPPGEPTGNYQKKVDRVFPPFGPLYRLPTPMTPKGKPGRQVRDMPHPAAARSHCPGGSGQARDSR